MENVFLWSREIWTGLALLSGSLLDVRERRLPVWFLGIFGGGSLLLLLASDLTDWQQIVIGVLPGAFLLLLGRWSGCIGTADGIVVLILGILYGGAGCGELLMLALLFTGLTAIVLIMLHRADAKSRLPFLPFLCAGYAAFLLRVAGR